MAATEACANDPRGSRVATACFKKGTVPSEPCNVHVSVELCDDSNMIASPYCTNTHTVSMLNIHREYPYEIAIVDAQYTYLPLPVGYAYPSDSSVPVYQNLLTPGTNPGYSPGVDDPMNHLCIVHYGYTAPQPGDPGYIDPNNPVEPTDPDDPDNPADPNDPDDPNNPDNPTEPGTTPDDPDNAQEIRIMPARNGTPGRAQTTRQTRPGRPAPMTRTIRGARRDKAIPATGEIPPDKAIPAIQTVPGRTPIPRGMPAEQKIQASSRTGIDARDDAGQSGRPGPQRAGAPTPCTRLGRGAWAGRKFHFREKKP